MLTDAWMFFRAAALTLLDLAICSIRFVNPGQHFSGVTVAFAPVTGAHPSNCLSTFFLPHSGHFDLSGVSRSETERRRSKVCSHDLQ